MIEKRDSHQGFDFMCTASDSGYRCGYVRIPEGHPLFGLGYTDPAPGISWEDLKGEMFGKRGFLSVLVANERESPSLRLVFDVHGSLTFSDRFRGDGPPGLRRSAKSAVSESCFLHCPMKKSRLRMWPRRTTLGMPADPSPGARRDGWCPGSPGWTP